jgi:hypothetical protein
MKIYVKLLDGETINEWSSSPTGTVDEVEVEIEGNNPFLFSLPRLFKLTDGVVVSNDTNLLNIAKSKKDAELNDACNKSITDGFIQNIDGIDYWFSFDSEAQSNFQGSRPILNEGIVESINWTVRIGGKDGEYSRLPITKTIMDTLTLTILQHKDSNVSKYRDVLLPQVNSASTVDEVNAIIWS